MSDQVQIELIRAAGGFLTGVPAVMAAWFAFRASKTAKQVEKNTNGMTAHLVALTAKSSKAEGNLEGRAELFEENKHPQ